METIFLGRQVYDSLIRNCPNWMELRWREYSCQWHLNGVRVKGSKAQIENLKCQLRSIGVTIID